MSGAVPAGNTSEDKDLEKVLAACHDRLPPPAQWSAFAGYPRFFGGVWALSGPAVRP
jgi:hypothetical protein